MAASTVPAAKTAILTMLRALPLLNEVPAAWAAPTETEDLSNEMIYFEGPAVRLPEWRVLATPPPLDETYTLTLKVRNRTFDDDPASAEARTWEIVALIEAAIRADLRLGGLIRTLTFDEQEISTFPLSDGWYGEATVPIVCTARS